MRESASGKLRITGTPEATWLRPTTPNDLEFVASVTEQAMRGYVEQLFGRWDDVEQRRHSDACCHDRECRIVMVGSVAAGLLFVRHEPSELVLGRIYLMPDYQRSGIGTHLLRELLATAEREGKPLRLRALVNNPVRRLYERMGFRLTHSTDHHHHFEYVPLGRAGVSGS
jgi:GNAT superfamily N-acetyltransferase